MNEVNITVHPPLTHILLLVLLLEGFVNYSRNCLPSENKCPDRRSAYLGSNEDNKTQSFEKLNDYNYNGRRLRTSRECAHSQQRDHFFVGRLREVFIITANRSEGRID